MAARSQHIEATRPNPHTRRSRRFLPSPRCLPTSAHLDLALTRGKHHTPRSRACFTALHPHILHAHTRAASLSRASLASVSFSGPATRRPPRDSRRAPRHFHACVPCSNSPPCRLWFASPRTSSNETPPNLPELSKVHPRRPRNVFVRRHGRKLRLFTRSDRTEFRTYTRARHCINTNTFCIAAIFQNTYPYQYILPLWSVQTLSHLVVRQSAFSDDSHHRLSDYRDQRTVVPLHTTEPTVSKATQALPTPPANLLSVRTPVRV